MKRRDSRGFTLVELMIVIAVIAVLAVIAIPSYQAIISRAKRSEAYMNLRALHAAQRMYKTEHGAYSTVLAGTHGIGWEPEGYARGNGTDRCLYTYGFKNGKEGTNFFTGKLQTSHALLKDTGVHKNSFVAGAVADIDGDGKVDLITINQDGVITVVEDDTVS